MLFFAGEYDPTTPLEWGRRALAGLESGYFVELPGRSHVVGFGACGRSIAPAFLRNRVARPIPRARRPPVPLFHALIGASPHSRPTPRGRAPVPAPLGETLVLEGWLRLILLLVLCARGHWAEKN
jgi:TAP-like protein